MSWGQILFSFEGRVGRKTYWLFLVAVLVIFGIAGALSAGSMTVDPATGAPSGGMPILLILASLVIIWPSIAIAVKRWHDVDKSGWWVLIGLVPAVGGLIALIFNGFVAGTPGPNRFGNPPA